MGAAFSRFSELEEKTSSSLFHLPKAFLKHPEHMNYTEEKPSGHNTKLFIMAIERLTEIGTLIF